MPPTDQSFFVEFSTSEKRARLRLIRTERVGPVTFDQLVQRFGSATKALEALPDLAGRGGAKRAPKIPSERQVAQEMAEVDRLGAHYIYLGQSDYPAALRATEDAPPVLMAKGSAHLLLKDQIAIVGARNASAAGSRLAMDIAAALGKAGLVVTSGLARGIDGAAHKGALATGTIAVIAGGIDNIYPPEHAGLQSAIAEQGCLVTEMPPGLRPQARHFPRRNRIVAGLALGTLVVEAAQRSGSLITARLANEIGREVFAIPGSPLDPRSRGTNALIRNGATLTESAADILDALDALRQRDLFAPPSQPYSGFSAAGTADVADADRRTVREALSPVPTSIDSLSSHTEIPPAALLIILLELELAGQLERHPGGRVSLLQP